MLKIGLTGGIGCGKSTVGQLFSSLGIPVLDADLIARELVEPGSPALAEIVRQFGSDILIGGQLDRARLRAVVFESPTRKRELEAILHPLVYQILEERVSRLQSAYCILAIPLLIETEQQSYVDRVLVVDCAPELQRARVKQRDGLDDMTIERIMESQSSRNDRLQYADDVIDNSGEIDTLRRQVERLHHRYTELAHAAHT